MYRVYVIDDEIWALKGVISTFPWEKYGFSVAGSSTNASVALKEISELKPDVVFSDICLPSITGLEICKKLREAGISPRFVFVSGYDDYKYTREAIINNAFDYCLKPIDSNTAREVLIRLKRELDEKSGAEEDEDNIYNKAFKELVSYINTHYAEEMKLNKLAKMFFINENYCCSLFNKYYGMSFSKYVNKVRIEAAIKLFDENKTLSSSEVAHLCGYVSYQHFNKRFKEIMGVLPSRYRKSR